MLHNNRPTSTAPGSRDLSRKVRTRAPKHVESRILLLVFILPVKNQNQRNAQLVELRRNMLLREALFPKFYTRTKDLKRFMRCKFRLTLLLQHLLFLKFKITIICRAYNTLK